MIGEKKANKKIVEAILSEALKKTIEDKLSWSRMPANYGYSYSGGLSLIEYEAIIGLVEIHIIDNNWWSEIWLVFPNEYKIEHSFEEDLFYYFSKAYRLMHKIVRLVDNRLENVLRERLLYQLNRAAY